MKNKLLFTLLCMVIVLATISVPVAAADWPLFRNDVSNSGASSESINLPLTEQWHSNAPDVEENGAVVSNGIVYMPTEDGKLYAFTVATGAVVAGFPVTIGASYSSPAVDSANKKIYTLTGSSLQAFNLDGTPAWTATVGGAGYNYNQGPVIDAGFVYVKAGGNLQKFNSGGALQWSSPTSGWNTQSSIMGDYVYVNSEAGQIRKYNKATGTEVTTGGFPISTSSSMAAVSTVNGKIFNMANNLYAYNANDGSLLWSVPAGGDHTYYGSPAVSNGVVYIYGWDGRMYAFDENTGATMSGFPSVALNNAADRNWNSPAIAGDKIFIGAGTSQYLKVLGAAGSANAGQVLAQYKTFSTDAQGFDLCSPVISDGVVFAMLDGGGLYAFFASGTEWTGGAIKINTDAGCTESQDVTLSLDRGSNTLVTQMRISEDPLFTSALWEPYSATKLWTLSAGYGTKTVYVQFRDSNLQLSNVFNDQIEYSESCQAGCAVIKAVSHCDTIQISWTTTGADHYNVYRSTTSGGPYAKIGSVTTGSYDDSTVISGTSYYYVIRDADKTDTELCQSNEVSGRTSGTCVPEFPSAFLPVAMIIGLLGAVMLIQRTREH
jgi:outer membrane protein assembly factor BamB